MADALEQALSSSPPTTSQPDALDQALSSPPPQRKQTPIEQLSGIDASEDFAAPEKDALEQALSTTPPGPGFGYDEGAQLPRGNAFVRGTERAWPQTKGLYGQFVREAGDEFGLASWIDIGDQYVKESFLEAVTNPGDIEDLDDITWSNAGTFVAQMVGEQVFNIGVAAAGSAIGVLTGGTTLPGTMAWTLTRATMGKAAAKALAKRLPKHALMSKKSAAALGGFGAFLPINTGEIIQEQRDAGLDPNFYSSLALGVPMSALEVAGVASFAAPLFRGFSADIASGAIKTVLKRFGHASLSGLIGEGGTEAAQEVLVIASRKLQDPTFDIEAAITSSEGLKRLGFAAAAGGAVGFALGGAGGTARGSFDAVRNRFQLADLHQKTDKLEKVWGSATQQNSLFDVKGAFNAVQAKVNPIRTKIKETVLPFLANPPKGVNEGTVKARIATQVAKLQEAETVVGNDARAVNKGLEFLDALKKRTASALLTIENVAKQLPAAKGNRNKTENASVEKFQKLTQRLIEKTDRAVGDAKAKHIAAMMRLSKRMISAGLKNPKNIKKKHLQDLQKSIAKATATYASVKTGQLNRYKNQLNVFAQQLENLRQQMPEVETDATQQQDQVTGTDRADAQNQSSKRSVWEGMKALAKGGKRMVFAQGWSTLTPKMKKALKKLGLKARTSDKGVEIVREDDNFDEAKTAEYPNPKPEGKPTVAVTTEQDGVAVSSEAVETTPEAVNEAVERRSGTRGVLPTPGRTTKVETVVDSVDRDVDERLAEVEGGQLEVREIRVYDTEGKFLESKYVLPEEEVAGEDNWLDTQIDSLLAKYDRVGKEVFVISNYDQMHDRLLNPEEGQGTVFHSLYKAIWTDIQRMHRKPERTAAGVPIIRGRRLPGSTIVKVSDIGKNQKKKQKKKKEPLHHLNRDKDGNPIRALKPRRRNEKGEPMIGLDQHITLDMLRARRQDMDWIEEQLWWSALKNWNPDRIAEIVNQKGQLLEDQNRLFEEQLNDVLNGEAGLPAAQLFSKLVDRPLQIWGFAKIKTTGNRHNMLVEIQQDSEGNWKTLNGKADAYIFETKEAAEKALNDKQKERMNRYGENWEHEILEISPGVFGVVQYVKNTEDNVGLDEKIIFDQVKRAIERGQKQDKTETVTIDQEPAGKETLPKRLKRIVVGKRTRPKKWTLKSLGFAKASENKWRKVEDDYVATNGHVLDLGNEEYYYGTKDKPGKIKYTRGSLISKKEVDKLVAKYQKAKVKVTGAVVNLKHDNEKIPEGVVYLETDRGIFTVNRAYYDHMAGLHPDAEWFVTRPEGVTVAAAVLKEKGKVVGAVATVSQSNQERADIADINKAKPKPPKGGKKVKRKVEDDKRVRMTDPNGIEVLVHLGEVTKLGHLQRMGPGHMYLGTQAIEAVRNFLYGLGTFIGMGYEVHGMPAGSDLNKVAQDAAFLERFGSKVIWGQMKLAKFIPVTDEEGNVIYNKKGMVAEWKLKLRTDTTLSLYPIQLAINESAGFLSAETLDQLNKDLNERGARPVDVIRGLLTALIEQADPTAATENFGDIGDARYDRQKITVNKYRPGEEKKKVITTFTIGKYLVEETPHSFRVRKKVSVKTRRVKGEKSATPGKVVKGHKTVYKQIMELPKTVVSEEDYQSDYRSVFEEALPAAPTKEQLDEARQKGVARKLKAAITKGIVLEAFPSREILSTLTGLYGLESRSLAASMEQSLAMTETVVVDKETEAAKEQTPAFLDPSTSDEAMTQDPVDNEGDPDDYEASQTVLADETTGTETFSELEFSERQRRLPFGDDADQSRQFKMETHGDSGRAFMEGRVDEKGNPTPEEGRKDLVHPFFRLFFPKHKRIEEGTLFGGFQVGNLSSGWVRGTGSKKTKMSSSIIERTVETVLKKLNIKEKVIIFDDDSIPEMRTKLEKVANSKRLKKSNPDAVKVAQRQLKRLNKIEKKKYKDGFIGIDRDVGVNNRVVFIYSPNWSSKKYPRGWRLAHELGHLVQYVYVDTLPEKTQKLIYDALVDGRKGKDGNLLDKEELFANWMAAEIVRTNVNLDTRETQLAKSFQVIRDALQTIWQWAKNTFGYELAANPAFGRKMATFHGFLDALYVHTNNDVTSITATGRRGSPGFQERVWARKVKTDLGRIFLEDLQQHANSPILRDVGKRPDIMQGFDPSVEAAVKRATDPVLQNYWEDIKKFGERFIESPLDAAKTVLWTADGELRAMGPFGVWLARQFRVRPGELDVNPNTVLREIMQAGGSWHWRLHQLLKDMPTVSNLDYLLENAKRRWKGGHQPVDSPDAALRKELLEVLQLHTPIDQITNPDLVEPVKEIRKYLNDLGIWYRKTTGSDLRFVKGYYPLMLDAMIIEQRRAEFVQILMDNGNFTLKEAEETRMRITRDSHGGLNTGYQEDLNTNFEFHGPGATFKKERAKPPTGRKVGQAEKSKKGQWTPEVRQKLVEAGFYQQDLATTMITYTDMVIRRAIWEKRFGVNVSKMDSADKAYYKAMGINPNHPIARLQLQIREGLEGGHITESQYDRIVNDILPAYSGQLGLRTNSQIRRLNAGLVIYQNLRLLGFAVLSSFVDVGTVLTRGDFTSTTEALEAMLSKSTREDMYVMLREIGALRVDLTQHVLNDQALNTFMSGNAKRINDLFFRYNGMEGWTNLMRGLALANGRRFIQRHAGLAVAGNETSMRYMQELGIRNLAEAAAWDGSIGESTNENLKAALNRYIDESMIRPDPTIRPVWMSDPSYSAFAHLKGFMYGFQATYLQRVMNRAWTNTKSMKGDFKGGAGALIHQNLWPLFILGAAALPFALIGYELRRHITNFGRPKTGPTGMDYILELHERAGIFGAFQMILDMEQANEYGKFFGVGISGPSVEQLYDFITRDLDVSLSRALPIVTQMPPAQRWIKDNF